MNHDDEWLAQEQALQRERSGQAHDRGDAQIRGYRVVMRALQEPPADLLPDDFAERVATLAERDAIAPARLETGLLAVLMTVLMCGLIALATIDGKDWLHALAQVQLFANPWVYALLGCLGLSQGIAWLRPVTVRKSGGWPR
jgi:hypothetical protein